MESTRQDILISREDIAKKVKELGTQINTTYPLEPGESLVLVCLLKGALPFTADLMRELTMPVRLEVMVASSYGDGTESTRQVNVKYKSFEDLEGQSVLVVDDITDSGHTLQAVSKLLESYGPRQLRRCTFLDKPSRREVEMEIEYTGFEIPDEFVIGYGLDFAGNYRELPDICVIREGE